MLTHKSGLLGSTGRGLCVCVRESFDHKKTHFAPDFLGLSSLESFHGRELGSLCFPLFIPVFRKRQL